MTLSWEQHYLEAERALAGAGNQDVDSLHRLSNLAEAVAHALLAQVGVTAENSIAEVRKGYQNLQIGLVTKTVVETIEEEPKGEFI